MHDELVEYDTARLAMEQGFDWPCSSFAAEDYKEPVPMYDLEIGIPYIGIPTQSLLQRWLREEHDYNVEVKTPDVSTLGWYYAIHRKRRFGNHALGNAYYDTYEQALEKGLIESLHKIKEDEF